MRSEVFDFENGRGERLSGRLDLPDGAPHAHALIAHCFTCDKTAKGAARIARALTESGVGVLRFDFTGLGESEGAVRGFSADVEDLVAAAKAMAAQGCAPALLIGHSLGGAAMLAAAADIPSSKAVATIGAPAEPAHVLGLLGEAGLKAVEAEGKAQVNIGGRPFTLDRRFVEDARMTHLAERIHRLGRALLVMHSPIDPIVGVENATAIFLGALHPKSFVSLDTADHLLSRAEDAAYAATVIAAWASRYIAPAKAAAAPTGDGAVHVEETGAGRFQVEIAAHGTRILADEPVEVGGLGSGLSPHELMSAASGPAPA